jgi:hypothetical protein
MLLLPSTLTENEARGREAGHAASSHAVLARSAIAPYVRRMVDTLWREGLNCSVRP